MAETPPNQQPSKNSISIFDDRTFNLDGGTNSPETRQSIRGNTRYLDKSKELDYNAPQRERWIAACESLKERDFKAFQECVASQKKKELGSRTNFGIREPRSGSDGLNSPAGGPRGMDGIRPAPQEFRPSEPVAEEAPSESDTSSAESESAE